VIKSSIFRKLEMFLGPENLSLQRKKFLRMPRSYRKGDIFAFPMSLLAKLLQRLFIFDLLLSYRKALIGHKCKKIIKNRDMETRQSTTILAI